jgi:glycosyltransferase involved in cell wall biosynthesis
VNVAIVVQRYGADINGGAELHARYIAEHLARHVRVEVLTTCATDYITWRNERPAGVEAVNGVTVRRFPVVRERVPKEFADWSSRVFEQAHSVRDELAWLEAEGPTSPALLQYVQGHEADYDFFVFFSFRYYHAFHGARAVPGKAILVPTAERDGALGLSLFPPIFRGIRALMYNSWEERALIHAVSGNTGVSGVVVGVGSDIPDRINPARFRQRFGLRERFAIYVGRIDENKGCKELFDFFEHYSSALLDGLHLVLIGTPVIQIPKHPRIHHLGFVTDEDKFDAIAASELLIMPSYFESLSMVALEAWALGKPVLANAACDVLHGQCLRSNAGLFYSGFQEFFETLRTIDGNTSLATALGQNGRAYFQRHYAWPVIERKYTDMLDLLKREPATPAMEPLPGWWAQRRRVLEAANDVVSRLPQGPARALATDRSEDRATVDERRLALGDSPADRTAVTDESTANRRFPSREDRDRRGGRPRGGGQPRAGDGPRTDSRRSTVEVPIPAPSSRRQASDSQPQAGKGEARQPGRGRRRQGGRR